MTLFYKKSNSWTRSNLRILIFYSTYSFSYLIKWILSRIFSWMFTVTIRILLP